MEQKTKLPPVEPMPLAKAKLIYNIELTRENYHKFLKEAQEIVFTKDNLNQDYTCLKKLRDIRTKLKALKDTAVKPYNEAKQSYIDAYKEIDAPIEQILIQKTAEFTKVNDEIRAENLRLEQERQKDLSTKAAIQEFIKNTTNAITQANTDTEIILIQKAVGSEKARTGFYGNNIDLLRSLCDNLNPIINQRKEFIRKQQELDREEAAALESGNIIRATEIKEEKDVLDYAVQENIIRMQETAFDQAVSIVPTVIAETAEVVAPRRKSWKWKVDDLQALYKKFPHLVELVPNKEKINELLAVKKEDGSLEGAEELKFNGITFYLEKLY